MPVQVDRRPSETLDGVDPRATISKQQAQQQQQQQQLAHREALRLALGSILTPKRPNSAMANPPSRSGTASPAHPFGAALSCPSGTHTPVGTPPVGYGHGYNPLAHGPNTSEGAYLHPHYGYYPHGYGHQPSRLGLSRSVSSATPSPSSSAQVSAHPSPRYGAVSASASPAGAPPVPPDIEPLPPAVVDTPGIPHDPQTKPVRPSITPLHPNKDGQLCASKHVDEHRHEDAMGSGTSSGSSTPRSKFLQTLQSKSAWDALIHGSFS